MRGTIRRDQGGPQHHSFQTPFFSRVISTSISFRLHLPLRRGFDYINLNHYQKTRTTAHSLFIKIYSLFVLICSDCMKVDSNICLLIVRTTVPISYFSDTSKEIPIHDITPKDVSRLSEDVKRIIDPAIKQILKESPYVSSIKKSFLIESVPGCIVSTIVVPFAISIAANLATPYFKSIISKVSNKIKQIFKTDVKIESNIVPLMDAINFAPNTIIIEGNANIIIHSTYSDEQLPNQKR